MGLIWFGVPFMNPFPSPEPTAPSELHQAGAVGRSAEPGLVVGYHEASWPRQVDLLLPRWPPRPQLDNLTQHNLITYHITRQRPVLFQRNTHARAREYRQALTAVDRTEARDGDGNLLVEGHIAFFNAMRAPWRST